MKVLVIANGVLGSLPQLSQLLQKADLIIAVDGGSLHCRTLGIVPDILIGDFDSTPETLLAEFEKQGSRIHHHPPRKDATDLELSLDLAMEKGAREIWLTGVLGGRWDMSFGNVLLLTHTKYKNISLRIFEETCVMAVLHPGTTILGEAEKGQTASLLVPGEDVENVSLKGFEYPLIRQTLCKGTSRGLSNIIQSDNPVIEHKAGVLLCIVHSNT